MGETCSLLVQPRVRCTDSCKYHSPMFPWAMLSRLVRSWRRGMTAEGDYTESKRIRGDRSQAREGNEGKHTKKTIYAGVRKISRWHQTGHWFPLASTQRTSRFIKKKIPRTKSFLYLNLSNHCRESKRVAKYCPSDPEWLAVSLCLALMLVAQGSPFLLHRSFCLLNIT